MLATFSVTKDDGYTVEEAAIWYAAGRERSPQRRTTRPDDDAALSFDFGPYEPVTAMAAVSLAALGV